MEPRTLLTTTATMTQTLTLAPTATNLVGQPLSPSLQLFNPSLGTLVSVTVTEAAAVSTVITATNTSTSSGTTFTGQAQDSYELDGLNVLLTNSQTLTTQPATLGAAGGSTPSSVTFPALVSTDSISPAPMTDTADLDFYMATATQSAITPTLTASAQVTGSGVGGNANYSGTSAAEATVTVSYQYIPNPGTGPTVARYGVHEQATSLVLAFNQALTATELTEVQDPSYYKIITPGNDHRFGTRDDVVIPINAANYDATTNAVTLVPAMNLNIHQPYELEFQFTDQSTPTVIRFNHSNLAGFNYHGGRFFAVVDGRVVR